MSPDPVSEDREFLLIEEWQPLDRLAEIAITVATRVVDDAEEGEEDSA